MRRYITSDKGSWFLALACGFALAGAGMVSAADEVNVVQLPELAGAADHPASSSPAEVGTVVQQSLEARGRKLLTPDGVAAALTRFEGSAGTTSAVATVGADLAQSVIDAGLQRIEQQAGHHFFRTLNLNWTPGFNGREDLYQIDAMMSLHDGEHGSLMTQLGLQGRNGEAGANAGLVLRTRAFVDWMFGWNVFYDYLSDPDVDRWSAGMELKGRWLGISSNIYRGMTEETSGSETMYSPDGWDVELSGHAPELPWLEYSGRYYKWNGKLSPELEGQDYRLTLRPVPLLDLSLRYDNAAQDGDSGFGIETQLSYEFGRPMSEQLSYQRVATPASSWARRFERVRREYEQRVQSRSSAVTTSVIRLTVTSSGVVAQIGNIPAGATQVVVSGGTGLGNSLTRAAPGAPAVRVHGGNCHVMGITDATCTFTESSGEITIANLLPGSYNFSASFQNAAGVTLGGPVQFTATIIGPTASLAVDNTAIAEAGGIATVTVTLDPAPTTAVTVNLTRSGTATIGAGNDYTATNLGGTDPTYSIIVTASAATASFTLTAVDDTMVDAAETAIFTIASVTGYTPASGSSAVTVTITDDDGASTAPTASLAVDNTAIAEAGGIATVTVTLDPAPTTAVTVNLTRSGTADIGASNDYSQTGLTAATDPAYSITVAANTATASFTLTAVDDTMVDAAETAIFTIASVTGYTPASGSSAVTVTITDATNTANAPPFFSVAACAAPVSTTGCIYVRALPAGTMSARVGITSAQGIDLVGLVQRAGGNCTTTELQDSSCVVSGINVGDVLTITGLTEGRTYTVSKAFFNTANAMGTALASEQVDYTAAAAGADAANAGLSNLQISGSGSGMLTPTFETNTIRYSLTVANSVTSITVTPTTAVTGAMVTVQGETVTSGMPSSGITLPDGLTIVDVVVTSSGGNTRITYGISVTRTSLTEPVGPVLSDLKVYPLVNNSPVTSRPQVYTPAFSVESREYRVFTQADVNALALVMTVPAGAGITSFTRTGSVMTAATPLGPNLYGLAFGGLTPDLRLGEYRVGFSISDGTSSTEYDILAVVAATLSTLSFHSSITADGTSVQFGTVVPMTPAFSPAVTAYTVAVPTGTVGLNAQVRVPREGITVYATSSLAHNRAMAGSRNMLTNSRDIVVIGEAGYVIEVIEVVSTETGATTTSTYRVTFTGQ